MFIKKNLYLNEIWNIGNNLNLKTDTCSYISDILHQCCLYLKGFGLGRSQSCAITFLITQMLSTSARFWPWTFSLLSKSFTLKLSRTRNGVAQPIPPKPKFTSGIINIHQPPQSLSLPQTLPKCPVWASSLYLLILISFKVKNETFWKSWQRT